MIMPDHSSRSLPLVADHLSDHLSINFFYLVVVKFILDCLQPLIIEDDKQVVHLSAMKLFTEPRRVCP